MSPTFLAVLTTLIGLTVLSSKRTLWKVTTNLFLMMASALTILVIFSSSIQGTPMALLLTTLWTTLPILITGRWALNNQSSFWQRIWIALTLTSQTLAMIALTSHITILFLLLEAMLLPTMALTLCWATRVEKSIATIAFLIYFKALHSILKIILKTLNIPLEKPTIQYLNEISSNIVASQEPSLWIYLFVLSFIIKLPFYTLHLWLPMTFIKPPMISSMFLTITLLNVGGYMITQMSPIMPFKTPIPAYNIALTLLIPMALIALCSRTVNTKRLITLSSLSLMNLIIVSSVLLPKEGPAITIILVYNGLIMLGLLCSNFIPCRTTSFLTRTTLQGAQLILMAKFLFKLLTFTVFMDMTDNFKLLLNPPHLLTVLLALAGAISLAYSFYKFVKLHKELLSHLNRPKTRTLAITLTILTPLVIAVILTSAPFSLFSS